MPLSFVKTVNSLGHGIKEGAQTRIVGLLSTEMMKFILCLFILGLISQSYGKSKPGKDETFYYNKMCA